MHDDLFPIRLQAYMAKCGVGSRRHCEELIAQGRVMVNNKQVREMGVKVGPDDVVQVDTETIELADQLYYIALNKPRKYVCTNYD
ncbi:MAG: S4 domain-containing protein, partial [Candidatus Ornithospirochaeta sp.]|nr:S4 domain-containing protein [Candidatus Ornithospirochaeta sp.]